LWNGKGESERGGTPTQEAHQHGERVGQPSCAGNFRTGNRGEFKQMPKKGEAKKKFSGRVVLKEMETGKAERGK